MSDKYGLYTSFIEEFKKVYQNHEEWNEARRLNKSVITPYTKWKVTDLLELAEKRTGVYNQIVKTVAQAKMGSENDPNTQDAKNALGAIAPNGMDWEGFACMMATAQNILNGGAPKVACGDKGNFVGKAGLIKMAYQQDYGRHIRGGLNVDYTLSGEYNTWKEADLTSMAQSRNGREYVEYLNAMAVAAYKKDPQNHFTKEALQAQNALAELAPNGQSWAEYATLIKTVAAKYGILVGAVLPKEVLLSPEHDQARLQQMDAKTATLHRDVKGGEALPSGETPELQALAAVRGLNKGTVRAA